NKNRDSLKGHLRACGGCGEVFLNLAAGGIFRAQVSIGSGPPGTRWERLKSLVEAGVFCANEEMEAIRESLRTAFRKWSAPDETPAKSIRPRGATPQPGASGTWPECIEAPLHRRGDNEFQTVRLRILSAPTITKAGEFRSACSARINLVDAKLFCTIHPDLQTEIVFEQSFRPDGARIRVEIIATGFLAPERDLIVPRDYVCFSVSAQ
ncbi:MAG TPA: hypothetical protein VFV34_19195, partial [Blastocatellia bacterium]|nr:hypothetical protein [Blastocatellia bacterium]